jgi:hypothetical protein
MQVGKWWKKGCCAVLWASAIGGKCRKMKRAGKKI